MNYLNLIEELAPMNRCHNGPEMHSAYEKLIEYYDGAALIKTEPQISVNEWKVPPYWICNEGKLIGPNGEIIADAKRNWLEIYSYSPKIKKKVTREELEKHLSYDTKRPKDICFHFRNQYRNWEREWGFCISYETYKELKPGEYTVDIDSSLDYSKSMVQAEYIHQGESEDAYLFLGHFDHPAQVNDGLAGVIASFEIIKRLKGKKTKYTYMAFASVEIVGSVFYLSKKVKSKRIQEALFLGFSGISSETIYQQSFRKKSKIDKIVKYLLKLEGLENNVYNHREKIGNDENVFDSNGYEIPTGTLMRWPFEQYHSDKDNTDITSFKKIEEQIEIGLKIIEILERDRIIEGKYNGLVCLSNPEINLYISPNMVSNIEQSQDQVITKLDNGLSQKERMYVQKNANKLNQLMQNILRMSKSQATILDIAIMSEMPFMLVYNYAIQLEEKGILCLK